MIVIYFEPGSYKMINKSRKLKMRNV